MAVDEPWGDDAPLEPLALTEVVGRADGRDAAVVSDRYRAVGDRLALDRDHPVRGDDSHSASAAERSQRRSITTAIQIESS